MEKLISGTIMTAVGFAILIFRDKFIRNAIAFQNKAFGLNFGENTIEVHKWLAIPCGIALIVFGILTIAGKIN